MSFGYLFTIEFSVSNSPLFCTTWSTSPLGASPPVSRPPAFTAGFSFAHPVTSCKAGTFSATLASTSSTSYRTERLPRRKKGIRRSLVQARMVLSFNPRRVASSFASTSFVTSPSPKGLRQFSSLSGFSSTGSSQPGRNGLSQPGRRGRSRPTFSPGSSDGSGTSDKSSSSYSS